MSTEGSGASRVWNDATFSAAVDGLGLRATRGPVLSGDPMARFMARVRDLRKKASELDMDADTELVVQTVLASPLNAADLRDPARVVNAGVLVRERLAARLARRLSIVAVRVEEDGHGTARLEIAPVAHDGTVLPALVVDTALVSSETYKDLYAFVHDIRSIGPEPYFVRVDGMPKEVTFEDPLALLDWVEERAGASRSQKGRQKRAAKPAAPATTSSLGARLNAAKETSVALNKATDELNARLSLVEATLVDLNLGVSASIPLLEGTTLSFRKRADEWGFYVDADKSVPIQSASREARLAAVGCLESLIDELLTKTTSQLDQVQNGVATVDALLGELKGAVS